MEKTDVDSIIADVFRLSGQKLTADDPIVAVLLMQQHRIRQAFKEQQTDTDQVLAEFMIELEQRQKAITQAADELKSYREQILADLLAKTNEQLEASEGRLYSGIQQKIARQTEAHIDSVAAKINRSLLAALVVFCLAGLLLKFI